LLLLPGGYLALLLAVPLGWLVLFSVGYPQWSLDAYRQVLESDAYHRVLGRTLGIAGMATLLALLVGYPVGWALARLSPGWRALALGVVLLPLWTSLLVRSYAWMVLLGPAGPLSRALVASGLVERPPDLLYSRLATLVGLTHSVLPYLILPIYAACLRVDSHLVRAAATLGASPLRTFLHVTLPLTLPGVGAGCVLAFVLGLGAFVIPALLGGRSDRMLAMAVESAINQLLDWNLAAALAIVLMVLTLAVLAIQERLLGVGTLFGATPRYERLGRVLHGVAWLAQAGSGGRRRAGRTRTARDAGLPARAVGGARRRQRLSRSPKHHYVLWTVAGGGLVYLSLPLLIVVPISFSASRYLQFPPPGWSLQWYERYLGSPAWMWATGLSTSIGVIVAALAALVGGVAAWITARDRFPGRGLFVAGCLAPMLVPNMVLALALYFTLASVGLVGTVAGLVLAHSLLALPVVFVTVTAGLSAIDPTLERAAAVLGASPPRVLWRIVLPLLRPSLAAAALFAFVISFDEIVVSLFLTSVGVRTLPKMMWENIVMEIDPTISAVSACLILVSFLVVVGTERLTRRSAASRGPNAAGP
jgi:putative spermidine/putrescine transport system permease protein